MVEGKTFFVLNQHIIIAAPTGWFLLFLLRKSVCKRAKTERGKPVLSCFSPSVKKNESHGNCNQDFHSGHRHEIAGSPGLRPPGDAGS